MQNKKIKFKLFVHQKQFTGYFADLKTRNVPNLTVVHQIKSMNTTKLVKNQFNRNFNVQK